MQNAAKRRFWDHTMGGEGGGGSEPRTGIIYIQTILDLLDHRTRAVCNNEQNGCDFASLWGQLVKREASNGETDFGKPDSQPELQRPLIGEHMQHTQSMLATLSIKEVAML